MSDRERLKALFGAVNQEPVVQAYVERDTVEDHLEHLRESITAEGNVGTQRLHAVMTDPESFVICYTGNGPHSEANAAFIAFVYHNREVILRALLDVMDRQEARAPVTTPTVRPGQVIMCKRNKPGCLRAYSGECECAKE